MPKYNDQEEFLDDQPEVLAPLPSEEEGPARQFPWMGIALMIHGLAFLVFALIAIGVRSNETIPPLKAAMEDINIPPLPLPEEEVPTEFPEDVKPVEDPTVDPVIEPADAEVNEDPTDVPNNSLAENPNADNTDAESPSPNKFSNSSLGLAGGGGGGQGRTGGGGMQRQRTHGRGKSPFKDPVTAALQWLADHQNPAGYWSASNFVGDSRRTKSGAKVTGNIEFRAGKADTGWESANVGLTGLALLAFSGDGITHVEAPKEVQHFKQTVKAGLFWLTNVQDMEGCFGPREGEEFVYNHAICTMALAEIYHMTSAPFLRVPAQRATDFIIHCQNPGMGWRYGVKPGENDSSVTAWMVLALKTCKLAGLAFNEESVYTSANAWYDRVTVSHGGYEVTGYNAAPSGGSGFASARLGEAQDYVAVPSMDACNAMVRLFTNYAQPGNRLVNGAVKNMVTMLPTWEHHKLDFYYWYYASLALYQVGGSAWESWEKACFYPVLLKHQRGYHPEDIKAFGKDITRQDGRFKLDEHGSWDPVDAWGTAGGRVYSTAINCLTLQVYYRYTRMNENSKKG